MTKIAFMFPGQGSFEAGMGKDVAEAVPEAMAVYDEGCEASGLDLKELCFDTPVEELVDTEVQQPALVATSPGARRGASLARHHADFVVGHSVGEFAALGSADSLSARDAIALVRERGLAMADAARAASRLDGGDPRARRRGGRGALQEDRERVAGELQLPRPARDLGRDPVGRRGLRRGARREGARRAVKLRVSGAFHSPLVARAADVCGRRSSVCISPRAGRRVHVDRDREARGRQRYRELLIEQLTAPVQVHAGGARARSTQGVTTFVEVGPGNVLGGLLKRIDSSVRTLSVNDLSRSTSADRGAWLSSSGVRVARGQARARHRRSNGIGRAIARELARAGATVVVGYRSGKDEAEQLAAEIGGRAVQADVSSPERREAAGRGGRRRRRARQQRRADARRPARAHVGRRLARP